MDIGLAAQAVLGRAVRRMQAELEHVRWTRPEHLHLTIKFIGDVDNRELPGVCDVLQETCRSAEPFVVEVQGLGTFPKHKPPRVLWAGITDEDGVLRELHHRFDQALAELGIASEVRNFTPHITLGRVGSGTDQAALATLLADLNSQVAAQCEVDELHLMATIRERRRIEYHPIETCDL